MSLVGGLLALVVIAIDRLGPWLPPVPVILSICGAPLRLAVFAEETLEGLLQFIRPPASRPAVPHSLPMRPSVPYGVAIAAAGVTVLVFQSSLPR
jgi:hypothetical protein